MTGEAVSPGRSSEPSPLLPAWANRLEGPAGTTLAAILLLALTLVALGPTLFSGERVFSNGERDLALQFVHWRKFGFDELRAGHLALWNPHIYCGAPFFGGFQSALLYPPNWLYLCLPLAVAVNVGIALHVFLAGFGMFLWMRTRGLHPWAALFAGTLFMFSGPYFPHIYAGHLSNLCTMVWGPFLFLAIDGWLRWRTAGWLLLGAGAVAMQILAGHPQYVFYTGVAAALYCGAQLAVAEGRARATAGLAVLALAGAALSAVQLLEGMHAAGESIRRDGTGPEFAAIFSFPPENFLTLLAPNFFGDLGQHVYWGRWLPWEMSLFFGVSGLVLAGYGLARGPRFQMVSCATIAAVLLVFALGSYTPLFDWLYHHAPGFNRFRGWSKFTFPAVLLLLTMSATGMDHLLRHGVPHRRPGLILLVAGSLLFGGAVWAHQSARTTAGTLSAPWNAWIHALSKTGDQYLSYEQIDEANFVRQAARQSSRQLRLAGGMLMALGLILLLARRYRPAVLAIPLLAACEMLGFAHATPDSFRLHDVLAPPEAARLAADARNGCRVNDERNHNLAMSVGAFDLWGYDPGVLRRYAEWMAASQDRAPDTASESMKFEAQPDVFATLLRCRFHLPPSSSDGDDTGPVTGEIAAQVGPRLRLVPQARILPKRDEALDAIFAADFDPAQTVVLETPPGPAPEGGGGSSGQVRLVGETTDTLTIEAEVTAPAILLITDTYSDGWKARSLRPRAEDGSVQVRYDVMPADYCLRAIPLARGHHEILLEYRPIAFVIGKWVSLVSLGLYVAAFVLWAWSRYRGRGRPTPLLDRRSS